MPKIVDHEQRRDELTEVAVRLIAKGGMEAATIREIAKMTGYSKGVVEHYFDNKAELISAALRWVNLRYQQRAASATENLRGLAALKQCLKVTLPMTEELRMEWKVRLVFWSMAAVDDALHDPQSVRFQKAVHHFSKHIQEAFNDGELSHNESAEALSRRLLNLISGMSIAALHNARYGSNAFLQQEIDYLTKSLSLKP